MMVDKGMGLDRGDRTGGCDHLVLGTSLPWLLAPRACTTSRRGTRRCARGRGDGRAARVGEKIRQALDLEHWAAFQDSFRRLCRLADDVASGRRGDPPGDDRGAVGRRPPRLPERAHVGDGATSRVYQAVCSPFRNPLDRRERRIIRFGWSRPAKWLARALSRSARVEAAPIAWSAVHKAPWFDNQVATLRFEGRQAVLRLERTKPGQAGLECVFEHALA